MEAREVLSILDGVVWGKSCRQHQTNHYKVMRRVQQRAASKEKDGIRDLIEVYNASLPSLVLLWSRS